MTTSEAVSWRKTRPCEMIRELHDYSLLTIEGCRVETAQFAQNIQSVRLTAFSQQSCKVFRHICHRGFSNLTRCYVIEVHPTSGERGRDEGHRQSSTQALPAKRAPAIRQ
jgi:hypothetical protein